MFLFRIIGRLIGVMVKAVMFVAAIAVVAAAVAYALFDAEAFKRELAQRVVDVTGRVLAVDGSAELQLGLRPRIVLNNVRLSNAQWGTRKDMARIRRVEIDIDPTSIVSGGTRIAQVRLDGADVILETDGAGAANWQLAQAAPPAGAAAAQGLLSVLGGSSSVVLSNTVITFHDGGTGATDVIPIDPPVEVGPVC